MTPEAVFNALKASGLAKVLDINFVEEVMELCPELMAYTVLVERQALANEPPRQLDLFND
jgi:hypothetical protein